MNDSKLTIKLSYLLFTAVTLASCGTYSTSTAVQLGVPLASIKKVTIESSYDPLKIRDKVAQRLIKLGFCIVEMRSSGDLAVHYNYDYHFAVFHYTFNLFNMRFVKAETGEVILTSSFSGDTPLGVDGLLDRIFADVERNIKLAQ